MSTATVTNIRTPAQILSGMDDKQLACRSQRHPFPILVPGRKIPSGFRQVPQRDGTTMIIETCPLCGKERTTVLNGGFMDERNRYSYNKPEGWVTIPRDLEITVRELRAELYRRVLEDQGKAQVS